MKEIKIQAILYGGLFSSPMLIQAVLKVAANGWTFKTNVLFVAILISWGIIGYFRYRQSQFSYQLQRSVTIYHLDPERLGVITGFSRYDFIHDPKQRIYFLKRRKCDRQQVLQKLQAHYGQLVAESELR